METWVQKAETEKRVNKSCSKMRRRFHDHYIFPDSKYMSFDLNFTFWCLILPQVHLCLVIPGCQKKNTPKKHTNQHTKKHPVPFAFLTIWGKVDSDRPSKIYQPLCSLLRKMLGQLSNWKTKSWTTNINSLSLYGYAVLPATRADQAVSWIQMEVKGNLMWTTRPRSKRSVVIFKVPPTNLYCGRYKKSIRPIPTL